MTAWEMTLHGPYMISCVLCKKEEGETRDEGGKFGLHKSLLQVLKIGWVDGLAVLTKQIVCKGRSSVSICSLQADIDKSALIQRSISEGSYGAKGNRSSGSGMSRK